MWLLPHHFPLLLSQSALWHNCSLTSCMNPALPPGCLPSIQNLCSYAPVISYCMMSGSTDNERYLVSASIPTNGSHYSPTSTSIHYVHYQVQYTEHILHICIPTEIPRMFQLPLPPRTLPSPSFGPTAEVAGCQVLHGHGRRKKIPPLGHCARKKRKKEPQLIHRECDPGD